MLHKAPTFETLEPFLIAGDGGAAAADFFVRNIRCGQCVHKIENHLNSQSSLRKYRLTQQGQKLHLEAESPQALFLITQRLALLGFPVEPLEDKNDGKAQQLETKRQLKEIAVAGVGAGNIMLYSTAIYLGAPEHLIDFFNGVSLFIFIPMMAYAGRPILVSLEAAIKTGLFNLDVPLGIAMVFGTVYSTANFFIGGEHVYFDSIAAVLFIVLVSRFLLQGYLGNFYRRNQGSLIPGVRVARVEVEGGLQICKPSQVQIGQVVQIEKGEVVPVDGELLSDSTLLDTAVLTGEQEPRQFLAGQRVVAGARVCMGMARVKTEKIQEETRVGQIVSRALTDYENHREERLKTIALFTGIIMTCAFLTFAAFAVFGRLDLAFHRAFAIVIVACPCAISFGFPLLRFLVIKNALTQGLLIKSPQVLAKLAKISHYCFDKTGTLTATTVDVEKRDLEKLGEGDLLALFALESQVDHPISRGIMVHYQDRQRLPAVTDFRFTPVVGIAGRIGAAFYEVKAGQQKEQKVISFYRDGIKLADIRLRANLRQSTEQLFNFLQQYQIKISLLSGDEAGEVQNVWAKVPPTLRGQALAQATPEQKREYIASLNEPVVMIGDGVNDLAAMQSAAVSVAMPGALEVQDKLSDVALLNGNLGSLLTLRKLARQIKRAEGRIFYFTVAYNLLVVVLAIFGFISPVVAAILMPISSGLILSTVFWHLRESAWS